MAATFNGDIKLPSNFEVQVTRPLDSRLVVDSIDDLTNGTITAPYQGMVVSIKGTSELWILKTQGVESSHDIDNWGKVTGTGGSGDETELNELRESLGILTDIVGIPAESDEATGLFKEIDDLKKQGVSATLGYTIPVMTSDMAHRATMDPLIEFDEDSDPYILDDYDGSSLEGNVTNNILTSINGTYLDVMLSAIRSLQMEVAKLKNSFAFGIDSYKNTNTAKSMTLSDYEDVTTGEPLWAIDPGYLSEVEDSINFNPYLDQNHSFKKLGTGTIDISVDGQLTFDDCKGVFYDGDGEGNNLTLYELNDSKLITYLVTNSPKITMNLMSLDNKTITRDVDFEPLMKGNSVNKYGFCVVISRKVSDTSTGTLKGFNYIYFSIINYDTDKKLYEGYLDSNGNLSSTRVDLNERYSIYSLTFDRLTLYRMKFYTKYEDFSEEVISSAPSESDYKYEVAHITIRSVANSSVLNEVKEQLKDDELVWNKKNKTLHIKSNGNIYLIGSNVNPDDGDSDSDNNDDNMTNKEILDALVNMGIVTVNYVKDTDGYDTDEVVDISVNSISDFTFVNSDTGKKFTFTVDNDGNLVGKDNSATTIEEFITSLGSNAPTLDASGYTAVRGFSSDYLWRKGGTYDLSDGVNKTGDAGKKSDRLRFSSFYAPLTTDTVHGCTHSFIELENTSNVDIPLTGVYLHFYNPSENDYEGKVHHLALDGVIPAGGTYLIRGAKHAEFDDASAFIKVNTFDKEWYENGSLISFEHEPVKTAMKTTEKDGKTTTAEAVADDSNIKTAYRFCLTYGLADLKATDKLVERSTAEMKIGTTAYDATTYPNKILNPRFIDSCSYSSFATVSSQTGTDNPWYLNGDSAGIGITITANTMFRLMFALDPAKQAYNGFNTKDGSRIRYNKATDMQILNLDKEFIGYPKTSEIIKIDRYTPKASFEKRNVMTDKTQLDVEKPNMVTCSFGNDVYGTRCFNWISCGTFDEYLWVRKQGDSSWTKFQSYTTLKADNPFNIYINGSGKVTITDIPDGYSIYYTIDGSTPSNTSTLYSDSFTVSSGTVVNAIGIKDDVVTSVVTKTFGIRRKEYSMLVNNTAYTRMINRFPGNNVLFTAHKCVIELPYVSEPTVYEYVVGRPDKDGKPDSSHVNDTYTFTLYPSTYEGRVYQITDQQGFHWIEYQVWAASAEYLNTKIASEVSTINADSTKTKVFPILINTGDMTQSGARINEWLDYYNGGKSLFNHMEQMNCVGNNDLCPVSPNDLGTGNDNDKSNSHFFHYFYCFDIMDNDRYISADSDSKKFFSGKSLVVPAHTCTVTVSDKTTTTSIIDRYIPSFYYFKTNKVMYIVVNSEIPEAGVKNWFGLCSSDKHYVNIYTGIEMKRDGKYDSTTSGFTPLYETMYAWLKDNDDNDKKKVVVAMHEMPFTVITVASLGNAKSSTLPCTRNHPTNGNRLGSNANQLNIDENRGIFWCSRLLEHFGCKLVIGGHKHTYALSYPIKERYTWEEGSEIYDSKNNPKPMYATLADEAGENPTHLISWDLDLSTKTTTGAGNRTEFNISTDTEKVPDSTTLNSTKTPYIPENLYNEYGVTNYNNAKEGIFRCCTPLEVSNTDNGKYDGFINYSMCQATGYKLKSNRELPSPQQVFSKIIPMTIHADSGDTPSGEQLYPMYSILEFNNDCSELDVMMVRIQNIFKANGKDNFDQLNYGTKVAANQYLCTYEKEDCDKTAANKATADALLDDSTVEADTTMYREDTKKIYKCVVDSNTSEKSWSEVSERMYGKWLAESKAKTRLANYLADPDNVSDNRYLHIIF